MTLVVQSGREYQPADVVGMVEGDRVAPGDAAVGRGIHLPAVCANDPVEVGLCGVKRQHGQIQSARAADHLRPGVPTIGRVVQTG